MEPRSPSKPLTRRPRRAVRRTPSQWAEIMADMDSGTQITVLSRKYLISRQAIYLHMAKKGIPLKHHDRGFWVECLCDQCGKPFPRRARQATRQPHHFCNKDCFIQYTLAHPKMLNRVGRGRKVTL
uniref:TRASH domain-containing protein n=1 Tax=viral metagenome TaxID=1070528 RepID=A0A6M3JID1_9ZZZZ